MTLRANNTGFNRVSELLSAVYESMQSVFGMIRFAPTERHFLHPGLFY